MEKEERVKKRLERLTWIANRVVFTPGELADFTNTSRYNALKYIRRLEAEGYLWEVIENLFKATSKLYRLIDQLREGIERREENDHQEK